MTYIPQFVSERESAHTLNGEYDDALWEDCVWTSGLMLANGRDGGTHPATRTEAELIRQAANKPLSEKGSTLNEFNIGLLRRYGYTLPVVTGVLPYLPVGWGAAITGLCGNFPAGHRLRILANFDGGHCVFIVRKDDGSYWWMDPLAPPTGYAGVPVTIAEIQLFMKGNATYMQAALVKESDMLISNIKGEDWRAKGGILRTSPDSSLPASVTLPAGTIIRSVAEVTVPGSAYLWRLTEYGNKPAYLAYKRLSDGAMPDWEPVVPGGDPAVDAGLSAYIARQPDPTPFSQADIDKKVNENEQKWETWVATHP